MAAAATPAPASALPPTATVSRRRPLAGDGDLPTGTYNGTVMVSLTAYDYCGSSFQRRAIGTQSYTMSAQLVITPPMQDPTNTEQNPFSLTFATSNQAASGAVSLASTLVVTTSGRDLNGNARDPGCC